MMPVIGCDLILVRTMPNNLPSRVVDAFLFHVATAVVG
jgi:hypothetical protein